MTDKEFMQRCFTLARIGTGYVSPNPMVGCVIVKKGKIVGEGFHEKFGAPHAEIMALLHAGEKARNSTMYVNLEPCAHYGKTPPCAHAVAKSGIKRVVIATKDPNPLINGKGIAILKKEGIHVEVGLLKKEAESLNEKFFKFMKTRMPFVAVKLAQTLDGRIADIKGDSKWITSEKSREFVHKLRSEYDAVLIGANTAFKDNPLLTVRLAKGRNPVRVIIDGRLSLPSSLKVFNTYQAPTWVVTSSRIFKKKFKKVEELSSKGVRVFNVSSKSGKINPKSILRIFTEEGISSVLIEGGADTVNSFIENSLVDKIYLFTSPKIIGDGLCALSIDKPKLIKSPIKLEFIRTSTIANDIFVEANFIKERS